MYQQPSMEMAQKLPLIPTTNSSIRALKLPTPPPVHPFIQFTYPRQAAYSYDGRLHNMN